MTSAAQVFAIPELLEMILTHADIKTLLRSQSVNKLFHATTLTSKTLRRNLYLDPTKRSGQIKGQDSEPRPVVNPLFEEFHNLNVSVEHYLWDREWTISMHASPPFARCTPPLPQGSWRKMLVCQLSCPVELSYSTFVESSGQYWSDKLPLAELRGPVTMGEVVDKFAEADVLI